VTRAAAPQLRRPRPRAAAQAGAVPRFGYALLLQRLQRYGAESRGPDAMDRRAALRHLQTELGCEEALLLQRGFDKAYRRVVEGV
jgi:hypothetical protein